MSGREMEKTWEEEETTDLAGKDQPAKPALDGAHESFERVIDIWSFDEDEDGGASGGGGGGDGGGWWWWEERRVQAVEKGNRARQGEVRRGVPWLTKNLIEKPVAKVQLDEVDQAREARF
ncbi:hypothetical protein HZH68_008531 [Vespula germanica]|uniref:Uncharacterized protein n=1 Tax=Vespula germanica TaxID=30212 RepID=A0A834N733_VESGE|nr:hypothetical protein HZH68_008531 [Vespula germanica]